MSWLRPRSPSRICSKSYSLYLYHHLALCLIARIFLRSSYAKCERVDEGDVFMCWSYSLRPQFAERDVMPPREANTLHTLYSRYRTFANIVNAHIL
jgi:hypothetical protein